MRRLMFSLSVAVVLALGCGSGPMDPNDPMMPDDDEMLTASPTPMPNG